ncbi:uncharacterized protein LOC118183321 isoform X2 [Stegodyphus dumicola]|uniref:uncharacterized protein LOC118183321 isoform X2 n=1 Tax=Stegodyphus dumicola TaxID=202533 RepID=UPI0015AF26B3|nr:uncharacterized protein LOC118183321 isoform X2 [Stegodyphus dumicola]
MISPKSLQFFLREGVLFRNLQDLKAVQNKALQLPRALKFISVVQDVCDKRRLYMERKTAQEYNAFLVEWKQFQKRTEQSRVLPDIKYLDENVQVHSNLTAEEMEELAKADLLLEKARLLRSKKKNLSKDCIASTKAVAKIESSNSNGPFSVSNISNKRTAMKSTYESPRYNGKALSHSKSTVDSSSYHRNSSVPRSKSANLTNAPKVRENIPKCCQSVGDISLKKNIGSHIITYREEKTIKGPSLSVLSNMQFHEFKKIVENNHLDDSSNEKGECVDSVSSDFLQNGYSNPHLPTKAAFHNMLKGKLSSRSSYVFHRSSIWYPFLSFENELSLFSAIKCNNLDAFINMYELIHNIQEALMWIDLLNTVGKESFLCLMLLSRNDKVDACAASQLNSFY